MATTRLTEGGWGQPMSGYSLPSMIETRIVKIVMLGSLALFAWLVTFDNLTDYQTNYAFVRHVLSMDATPPGNH